MHVTAEIFYPMDMYLLSCEINGRECISLLSTYHRQAVRLNRMSQRVVCYHLLLRSLFDDVVQNTCERFRHAVCMCKRLWKKTVVSHV